MSLKRIPTEFEDESVRTLGQNLFATFSDFTLSMSFYFSKLEKNGPILSLQRTAHVGSLRHGAAGAPRGGLCGR